MSPIRQELIAYSQQQRNDNQILRALLESNTWYAPAAFAAEALGRTTFDRVMVSARQEPLPAGGMAISRISKPRRRSTFLPTSPVKSRAWICSTR